VLLVGSGYILVEAEVSSSRWRTVHPRGGGGYILTEPEGSYSPAGGCILACCIPAYLLHPLRCQQHHRLSCYIAFKVIVFLFMNLSMY
jgi:hypothetical protein